MKVLNEGNKKMRIVNESKLNEASVTDILYEADGFNSSYKNVTIDFFIGGLNSGKIRKGFGFKNLGIDPDKGEVNIIFNGIEVMTIPVRKGTCSFEKINNTRFPTLVIKLVGLTIYVTWS